jgi:hypothetical protein
MTNDEPRGDCPFCDVPKWHVCDHFEGYLRGDRVTDRQGLSARGRATLRPVRPGEIAVQTGVSVRVYAKGGK